MNYLDKIKRKVAMTELIIEDAKTINKAMTSNPPPFNLAIAHTVQVVLEKTRMERYRKKIEEGTWDE